MEPIIMPIVSVGLLSVGLSLTAVHTKQGERHVWQVRVDGCCYKWRGYKVLWTNEVAAR